MKSKHTQVTQQPINGALSIRAREELTAAYFRAALARMIAAKNVTG
jgi:hypothetical protein